MDTPDNWQLDSEEEAEMTLPLTSRVVKKLGWKTNSHAQFRCPDPLYEKIEQYVSKSPLYKTRSEFFVDASYQLLGKLLSEQPDGFDGILRTQHFMDKLKVERISKDIVLDDAQQELERLQQSGDVVKLRLFVREMQMMYSDLLTNAPASYTEKLEELINKAQRLVRARVE